NVTRQGMSEIISEARFITSKEGYYDRWTPDNQDTNIPNPFSGTVQSKIESTQYLERADFIKLKNLSVGYTFQIIPNSSSQATVSVSVQNLATITSYSGYDPEVSTNTGNGDTNAGIDFGSYPTARTITLGVDISL